MICRTFQYDFKDLKLTVSQVERVMGYKHGESQEHVSDLMQDALENEMIGAGKKITNRFSPGYCGWNVAEQKKLFKLMDDNYCGIRLTPSSLMDPVKSMSGIIGIGVNVKRNPYTCSLCDKKDCFHRRVT
ncbi:MAG: hypothetical protein MUC93_11280 [Bacteroidales bacterium]|jgi:hypothetical protein|nr:hypothetical protein [Bacteroidales bacterium]